MEMKNCDEIQYLDLLRKILNEGIEKVDRTGIGTYSLFGERMEFDISNSIPILTTKKILWNKILIELLWIIKGRTDVDTLQKQGVRFWDANSSRNFLDKRGLKKYREGDLGPVYGFQWRHFGAEYKGCDVNYTNKGIDQLENVIELLENDPFSRRIIMTSWNPEMINQMALPPCHHTCQFNVTEKNGTKYLDCMLIQRSGDMFLGVPFNIASYSFLTYMIAHITNMKPRKFIHIIGDAHIYKNHIESVKKQLERTPYSFPQLKFSRNIKNIDDFKISDFIVHDYKFHSYISAPMAV